MEKPEAAVWCHQGEGQDGSAMAAMGMNGGSGSTGVTCWPTSINNKEKTSLAACEEQNREDLKFLLLSLLSEVPFVSSIILYAKTEKLTVQAFT